ncbi:hypothetical protein 40AC_1 [Mycobacterium phage 40AC]|uniref:Uncharacterized protein n=1 Tax=Mycobacterium phage 40AC TaxID=1458717 RepID=W8EHG0_9CAUD|nr:hypothetical protein ST40AC_1 [Mycobacterium phage 40AC]AHJ86365.1 hypothetical protein 40AC_1 [Mycobacterium phage 40AC]
MSRHRIKTQERPNRYWWECPHCGLRMGHPMKILARVARFNHVGNCEYRSYNM